MKYYLQQHRDFTAFKIAGEERKVNNFISEFHSRMKTRINRNYNLNIKNFQFLAAQFCSAMYKSKYLTLVLYN